MSTIDIEKLGLELAEKKFKEVVKEAETVMKRLAPRPKGTETGQGSYATGETRSKIHTEWHGDDSAFVGVTGVDHAKYADQGHKAYTKTHVVKWRDKHGRWHTSRKLSENTYTVGSMQGWHFVDKTKEFIAKKYNGR